MGKNIVVSREFICILLSCKQALRDEIALCLADLKTTRRLERLLKRHHAAA